MRSAPNSLTSLHSLSTLCQLNPSCRANTSASSEASPKTSSYSSAETLSWSWSWSSSLSSSSSSASEKARKVEVGDLKEKEAWKLRGKGRDQGRRRENERVVHETNFDLILEHSMRLNAKREARIRKEMKGHKNKKSLQLPTIR